MLIRAAAVVAALALVAAPPLADAKPALGKQLAIKPRAQKPLITARDPKKLGAFARVAYSRAGELRPPRDQTGRRAEPLTPEEEAAAQIEKLLRGPLRRGVTGLFVADAKTGEPLFAVNADDPLNPASNVKLISTATSLELLGADFRYPTRLLGPSPVDGVVHGDVYLLGSHDPTLALGDLDDIAGLLTARGIKSITGRVVVGADPTRDGIFRAVIPIDVIAGEPGAAPTATAPPGFDLVDVAITATTAKTARRSRLTYKTEVTTTPAGQPRIALTVGGTIGKGDTVRYPLWTKQRTATAAYALIAALRAHQIAVTGELKTLELGEFIGDAVAVGTLPVELGRHDSLPAADIVLRVNKWSVNWLADRLIMTAAALAQHQSPSMELALAAMYDWMARHPHVAKSNVVIDTGSGLSYRTQISPHELVSIVRSAGGFTPEDTEAHVAGAWLRSLSIAGADGTLQHRFRGADVRGRILGKTGTLSTVIALSGILDIDPQRPLAFSLVTNSDAPLSKAFVRRAHEQVIAEVCKYLARTAKTTPIPAPTATPSTTPAAPPSTTAPAPGAPPPAPVPDEALEEPAPDELDAETATSK